jgi:AraC-like DNA-binding protein
VRRRHRSTPNDARLLRRHRMPLREAARRVGYDSEFAFARAFKRTTGQYRSSASGGLGE